MADHDRGYKRLFSNPEMVADLLRGFVKQPWVQELDLETLERMSTVHVSDDLRERADDMIWRVRWRDRWLYVYLLIEFQSTSPWDMAVRIMTYLGLLYQELIRAKLLSPGGRLPPVLPLVLYNGARPWTAAEEIADLIEPVPPELARYQPQLRYLLVDESRYSDEVLTGLQNLVAALFRLEQSQSPEHVSLVLEGLIEWFKSSQLPEVKRSFTIWLQEVLLPSRLPGEIIPEVDDLGEVRAMLAERVREWTRPWVEQGRQEGVRVGISGILLHQLELRFGELPPDYLALVQTAPNELLQRWAERVLTSPSLAEIFADDQP